jgi:hypothetical protein
LLAREQGLFDVERILCHEPEGALEHSGVSKYLIRWLGYDSTHDTWEPACNIWEDCASAIDTYWACEKARQLQLVMGHKEAAIRQLIRAAEREAVSKAQMQATLDAQAAEIKRLKAQAQADRMLLCAAQADLARRVAANDKDTEMSAHDMAAASTLCSMHNVI